jgi:hypothetical protein
MFPLCMPFVVVVTAIKLQSVSILGLSLKGSFQDTRSRSDEKAGKQRPYESNENLLVRTETPLG